MLGKIVTVTVDRPLGSRHPKYENLIYPINYGYVKGVFAPDGEEQDAYVLSITEPISEFVGRVIAIIHREDDVEDKLVVAPDGVTFTEEEIKNITYFQERYFKSTITTWKGRAIVCLSIDDAKENMLSLIVEKLIPLKIPATINVVTGFIDGTAENRGYPCINKEKLIELYSTGLFEIANHGDSHKNTLDDIIRGREKIIEWLNLDKGAKLGFASPGSNMSVEYAEKEKDVLRDSGVLYVRTRDTSFASSEDEKDRHGFLDKYAFVFSSVVVYKGVTPKERLIELTEYAIKNNLTLVLMLHNFARSTEEIYQGDWTYDLDEFSSYLDYLCVKRREGEVEVLTTKAALYRLKK